MSRRSILILSRLTMGSALTTQQVCWFAILLSALLRSLPKLLRQRALETKHPPAIRTKHQPQFPPRRTIHNRNQRHSRPSTPRLSLSPKAPALKLAATPRNPLPSLAQLARSRLITQSRSRDKSPDWPAP